MKYERMYLLTQYLSPVLSVAYQPLFIRGPIPIYL